MAKKVGKGLTLTISGVDEIRDAYRLLPNKVAGKVVRQSIRAALKPMARRVKDLAPVGSGALADSIKVKARAKKKRGTIALDVVSAGDTQSKPYHSGFVNYGTKRSGRGGKGPGQEAQHFFERAFMMTKARATNDVRNRLRRGILEQFYKLKQGGSK